MDEQTWRDPSWRAGAEGWIADRVAEAGGTLTGAVEQPHVTPWATVLTVPTDHGTLWFKANSPATAFEARLVALLAARRPDVVPALVAADPDTGWMLMDDAGDHLRTVLPREGRMDRWLDVLGLYAGLQVDLVDDVDLLLAAGVPDRRLALVPEQYDALVVEVGAERRFRDASSRVRELCAEVAAYGLPETLDHDDLHDAQVFVRDGRHLLTDWDDACVSHPFFTLSVTSEGVIAWGREDEEGAEPFPAYRDAYLAPWAERLPDVDLVALTAPALRLRWACRAVNGHVPGDEQSTLTRLRMFLDGTPG